MYRMPALDAIATTSAWALPCACLRDLSVGVIANIRALQEFPAGLHPFPPCPVNILDSFGCPLDVTPT